MSPLHTAITAAFNADTAWSMALTALYGLRAGDARYDVRGRATPELQTLYLAKIEADKVMGAEFAASRAA